jgi:hypothetical protein
VEHIPGSPIPADAQTRLNILLKGIGDGMLASVRQVSGTYLCRVLFPCFGFLLQRIRQSPRRLSSLAATNIRFGD